MKKIRGEYSDEFIEKITEQFLSSMGEPDRVSRIRAEIVQVRAENYDAIFLEMLFALKNVMHEDAVRGVQMLLETTELDDILNKCHDEERRLADLIINYLEKKPSVVAKAGGDGRAAKFKRLEAETISLYKAGTWASVPDAALTITPIIVKMSSRGNGDLKPSTTKPLEWIRAHVKSEKDSPS